MKLVYAALAVIMSTGYVMAKPEMGQMKERAGSLIEGKKAEMGEKKDRMPDFMESLTDEQKTCIQNANCKMENDENKADEAANEAAKECMKNAMETCGIEMPEMPEKPAMKKQAK